jgi:Xaa-Pro aminopeptidase
VKVELHREPTRETAVSERWPGTWASMEQAGLDALIVYGRGAVGQYGFVHYLTGVFPSHKGTYAVLPHEGPPTIIAPTEAEAKVMRLGSGGSLDVTCPEDDSRDGYLALVARLARERVGQALVGLAAGGGAGLPSHQRDTLIGLLCPHELVPADDLLYGLKAHINDTDVRGLEDAVGVADAGLNAFANTARAGITEWEAAGRIECELRAQGALSTLVHVASAPFFGQAPTQRRIGEGDLVTVLVELTSWDGYWVEIGACFSCGGVSDTARKVADHCIRCLEECPTFIKPHAPASTIARELNSRISEAGAHRVIGLGHGVGIDEGPPIIVESVEDTIRDTSALAIHPSAAQSEYAVAVANTFIVDANSARPLSKYPYELHTFS